MPELPEVETIRRSLLSNVNASIQKVEIFHPGILRRQDYELNELSGQIIQEIARRGKFLVLKTRERKYLVIHLGMSGRFFMLEETEALAGKHIHAVLLLDNGRRLVYQDPRRFGGLWLVRDVAEFFAHMGCEPLEDEFNQDVLAKLLKDRKVAIKTLLLNQNLIAGIGNIYADEALFAAGILPHRAAGSLTEAEIGRLTWAIKEVLKKSIEQRGTTFRDFRDGYNQSGGFQNHLQVYGRINAPCRKCGQLILQDRIGGRSTHYCQHCQS